MRQPRVNIHSLGAFPTLPGASLLLSLELPAEDALPAALAQSGIGHGGHEVETRARGEQNREADDRHDWVGAHVTQPDL